MQEGVVSMRSLSSRLACGLALTGGLRLILPRGAQLVSRTHSHTPAAPTSELAPEVEARRRHEAVFALATEALPVLLRSTGEMRCGDAEMGAERVVTTKGRYAVVGPHDNADMHLARPGPADSVPAPAAPWARQDALGTDDQNALGRMWGDEQRDQSGERGFGRQGTPGSFLKRMDVAPSLAPSSGELRVVHTGLRITGPRSGSEIARAMAAHFDEFRRCGAEASPNEPHLVELELEIAADGRATVTSSKSAPLEQCLDRSLSQLLFLASSAAAHVVYPLHFVPASVGVHSAGAARDQAPTAACDCGG